MKKVTVIFIFILFITKTFSQKSFTSLKVEDGLSHNSVISMLQDHRGFMWFGTKDGLNRYDGYNFKIFRHQNNDPNSLGSNFIRCLHEINKSIWVGTDTGLFRYDEKTESFSLIEGTKDKPILDIQGDFNSNLWFIASGNLHRMDLNTNSVEEVYDQFYASFLTRNSLGKVYVASSDNVYEFEPDNNSFKKLEFKTKNANEFVITNITSKGEDSLYIGTKNKGAFVYIISNGQLKSLLKEKENPLFVREFLEINNQELWIASESGVFIYNKESDSYTNHRKSYNNPYSLSDNAIYSLVQDEENGIWIGTYFGGVNYYPKQYTPIKRYFPKVGENSISGNAVREIKKDTFGDLWIGTEDAGLNKFNTDSGKFENFPSVRNSGNLSHYNIHGLLPRGNELWIGTFEHGLDIMDINSGKIIDHFGTGDNEGNLRSDFILYIYETRNKDVYVLTSSGIHKFFEKDKRFEVVREFPEVYHYTYLTEDHNGTLWAGTYWDGLFYYNPQTKEKGFYRYNSNDTLSISSNVINGIFEDSSKNLWITTENGLNLYNHNAKNFTRYTKNEGLPSNVTYSILEDKEKHLWISTSSGLVEFKPDKGEMNVFTKSNGLLSDQFNYSSAYHDKSGEMYFGSVNGLISFNPRDFVKNNYHPPIYINDIQINNKEVEVRTKNSPLDKSLSFVDNLELNNTQSTFSLEFAALSYTAPEMTKYWYKLEGLNDDWIGLGKSHSVSFTELPPGEYNFKVKALNSHGVWSDESKNLKIEILPPFLASDMAYAIYTCLLILILYFLLKYYHRYNKDKQNRRIRQLENQKEKEIYQAKIEFFTNIAHEIRTPLTLIKSPLEKLLKNSYKSPEIPKNLGIMEKNTSRLLNLVNELLDFRKTEMKNVKLSFVKVNITELIEDTYVRFSQIIQDKNLQFNFLKPMEDVYAYVDEEAIKKILSNLFSNAVKYSESIVEVHLDTQNMDFTIIVKNDGKLISYALKKRIFEPFYRIPGEKENTNGSGIGLSLAHSLAELHNGRLSLDFKDEKLNTFVLKMPVHQEGEFKNIHHEASKKSLKEEVKKLGFDKSAPIILVAEDNDELADFISNEMAINYRVLKTKNGIEALQCIQEHDVQLVISDVMMPLKNGIELCKQIKDDNKTNHIPVILLTAKNALNAKIEGLESGADAYISKPFSMEHLQVQVSNLLENRRTILGHYSNSPLAHLKSISFSESDKSFLSQLDKVIDSQLKDPNLNVETLAVRMNMSRSTLYRKIKDISDMSPNELINTSRLKKAAFLLKTTNMKIYEVAEMVGYRSQTSFGRNFQKHFNLTPSEYIRDEITHT